MRAGFLLLFITGVALAQATLVPPSSTTFSKACVRDGDKDCVNVLGMTADKNGCMSPFVFNAKSSSCEVAIYFADKVTCGAAVQGSSGWELTCSAVPRKAIPAPAKVEPKK